jgi:acetyl-CoA carboxylase biotin carboxyl carrier protein
MAKETIKSEIAGTVWKIEVAEGTQISEEDTIMILESMKMEIPVEAATRGRVIELCVAEGDMISEDQPLAVIET